MEGDRIGTEVTTEAALLEKGYRKYSGKDVDIYYNKDICAHVGNCVRGNPAIFEVGRRPWIIPDNGTAENAMTVINTCPTGALKFVKKN